MNLRTIAAAVAALSLLTTASAAMAEVSLPTGFVDEELTGNLRYPISLDFLPDGRVLIAEQGRGGYQPEVKLWLPSTGGLSTVLQIPDVNDTFDEKGLLSVVVDPQWPSRPFLYAYISHSGSQIDHRVLRYELTGDLTDGESSTLTANTGSQLVIVSGIEDESNDHNGGCLRFGPDGMLYLSTGDDYDKCVPQDINSLAGKILRMDVANLSASATGVADLADITPFDNPFLDDSDEAGLVWTMGLRNPFRMHIDNDGSIFVADVGWYRMQEVSRVSRGGMNLGWPYYEGNFYWDPGSIDEHVETDCPEPGDFSHDPPVHQRDRFPGGPNSIIGAGIYRTPAAAKAAWPGEYEGNYFYADFFWGWIVRLVGGGDSWSVADEVDGQPSAEFWATGLDQPTDFQVGPDGSLWYLSRSGSMHRIQRPAVAVQPTTLGGLKARF